MSFEFNSSVSTSGSSKKSSKKTTKTTHANGMTTEVTTSGNVESATVEFDPSKMGGMFAAPTMTMEVTHNEPSGFHSSHAAHTTTTTTTTSSTKGGYTTTTVEKTSGPGFSHTETHSHGGQGTVNVSVDAAAMVGAVASMFGPPPQQQQTVVVRETVVVPQYVAPPPQEPEEEEWECVPCGSEEVEACGCCRRVPEHRRKRRPAGQRQNQYQSV